MAKAKGKVTYFDPYDGYGYIVPEGKKSEDSLAFSFEDIDTSQMVQAVVANDLVEFEPDAANPRRAKQVVRVKPDEAGKKAAAKKKVVKKAAAAKSGTVAKKAAPRKRTGRG